MPLSSNTRQSSDNRPVTNALITSSVRAPANGPGTDLPPRQQDGLVSLAEDQQSDQHRRAGQEDAVGVLPGESGGFDKRRSGMRFVPPAGKEFREARHRLYWRTEHPGTRVSQGSRGIEPGDPRAIGAT